MSPKYLVAAALLSFAAAPLSAQSVTAGIEAWQRSDYAGAVAIWRPLAEKGDPEAAFNLGQAYRLGRGVPISLSTAQSWYERAAAKGSVDAQTNLGLLLFQNGDHANGLKWLRKAAEQDDPRAQLVYGTALFNGDGITQDRMLGYAYVSQSAAHGLIPARETLAELDQLMPPADRKKALALGQAKPKARAAPPPRPEKPVRMAQAKPVVSKPEQSPLPKPARPVAAGGGWRIQLGAFAQRGAAELLFGRLSGKPALAGRGPFYIPVGSMTRLQVGPFASRAAAAAACASLGTACFAVPAK
jgi:hypothetical protein